MRRTSRTPTALLMLALLVAPGAQAASARYVGEWINTTFDTPLTPARGPIDIMVTTTATDFSATVDLGGFVFGAVDPDPFVIAGTTSGAVSSASLMGHPVFGDVTATLDAVSTDVSMSATNLPEPGTGSFISSAAADGSFDGTTMALNYLIIFNCGGAPCAGPGTGIEGIDYALGTMNATLVPLPGALVLFGSALLAMTRRRRIHG